MNGISKPSSSGWPARGHTATMQNERNMNERRGPGPKKSKRQSKFLSLVLRHSPQTLGIVLDREGWVDVATLLNALSKHRRAMTRDELEELVRTNDKKRFEFSKDMLRIRASQGHSVPVDLGYQAAAPPTDLYHGTVSRWLDAIFREGLRPMNRHHVHLSADRATARSVGGRYGRPVLLRVDTRGMLDIGREFYLSTNGVWLVDHVPPAFLSRIDP